MNKYTLEEVSARLRRAAKLEREASIPRGSVEWLDMAYAIDALLHERESAKAKSDPVAWRYRLDGDMQWQHTSDKRICMGEIEPLYAVAPMLASAQVDQKPYCYTVEQKNGLSQGAMCRTKAECEASPLFDPDSDHIIPLYREPMLASARVPDEHCSGVRTCAHCGKPKMNCDCHDTSGFRMLPGVAGVSRMWDNEKAVLVSFERKPTDDALRALHAMLAASPKPETEE